MSIEYVITGENIVKKFKGFTLDIPELKIPKGFATALIGENGAGKSTLMKILAGIRLDAKGSIRYFDACEQGTVCDENTWEIQEGEGRQIHNKQQKEDNEKNQEIDKVIDRERIGYVGPGHYYLPNWTVKQVEEVSRIMFEGFHKERFESLCQELAVYGTGIFDKAKKISSFSDGTKMKLMLANVLARDTELLVMDEPASPLDPLMRERLCEMIQEYIDEGNGEKSVFFSTHNVSDMENITDYAIIMEHGRIVEKGFVEDLKEKYILVKGEAEDKQVAKEVLYTMTANSYGFEGICLAENLDKLAGMNVTMEVPSLYQISVAVMKANSKMCGK